MSRSYGIVSNSSGPVSVMTLLEELVAREYLERNGFFLKLLYPEITVQSKKTKAKGGGPHPTYLIQRQTGRSQNEPLGDRFQLFSSDLGGLAMAILVAFGWSTPGLSQQVFQSGARYRSWVRNQVVPSFQSSLQGVGKQEHSPSSPAKMVLLPGLPVSEPYRQECIDLLKDSGVEAMFSIRTLLESLVGQIPLSPGIATSTLSEMIRLLKVYELIRPPQMDLFDDDF